MLQPYGIRELVQSGLVAVAGAAETPSRIARPTASSPPDPHATRRKKSTWQRCSTTRTPSLTVIQGSSVAIIGYAQGHAHALNLRDSGVDVRVSRPAGGLREPRQGRGRRAWGVERGGGGRGVRCRHDPGPDQVQRTLLRRGDRAHLVPGNALFFAHGFNIRFGYVAGRSGRGRVHGRAKGPGHLVRRESPAGRSGHRRRRGRRHGRGLAARPVLRRRRSAACARRRRRPRSRRRPRPTSSASRPCCAVGRPRSSRRASRRSSRRLPAEEVAFFECLHELKLIVDLMYEGGMADERWSMSDTAKFGDYVPARGSSTRASRARMKDVLTDIQTGAFAKRFIDDQAPAPEFKATPGHPPSSTDRVDGPRTPQAHELGQEPRQRLHQGSRRPLSIVTAGGAPLGGVPCARPGGGVRISGVRGWSVWQHGPAPTTPTRGPCVGPCCNAIQDAIVGHAGEWSTYLVTALLCYVDGFFPPVRASRWSSRWPRCRRPTAAPSGCGSCCRWRDWGRTRATTPPTGSAG